MAETATLETTDFTATEEGFDSLARDYMKAHGTAFLNAYDALKPSFAVRVVIDNDQAAIKIELSFENSNNAYPSVEDTVNRLLIDPILQNFIQLVEKNQF